MLFFKSSSLKILQFADFEFFPVYESSDIDEWSSGFCFLKSRPLSITIIENNSIIVLEIQGIL